MAATQDVAERTDGRIMYTRCPALPNASTLAHRLGYITDEFGGDAEVAIDEKIGADSHVAGFRYWLRHAGYAKPLWAWINGADTRLIAVSRHESACPIYALPGSGIASPADLKGRRIAVVNDPKLALEYNRIIYLQGYAAALARAGLDLTDVRVVDFDIDREALMQRTGARYGDLGASVMAGAAQENLFTEIGDVSLAMLKRGAVDAIASNLPGETVAELGLRRIYDSREDPDVDARHDLRCLVVSGAFVRERRDVLVRIVARLVAAGRFAAGAPDDAVRLLADDLRIAETVLRMDCDRIGEGMQLLAPDEALRMLTVKKDFLLQHGFIGHDAPVARWADFSILEEAAGARA